MYAIGDKIIFVYNTEWLGTGIIEDMELDREEGLIAYYVSVPVQWLKTIRGEHYTAANWDGDPWILTWPHEIQGLVE